MAKRTATQAHAHDLRLHLDMIDKMDGMVALVSEGRLMSDPTSKICRSYVWFSKQVFAAKRNWQQISAKCSLTYLLLDERYIAVNRKKSTCNLNIESNEDITLQGRLIFINIITKSLTYLSTFWLYAVHILSIDLQSC